MLRFSAIGPHLVIGTRVTRRPMHTGAECSYENAIAVLNSRRRGGRPKSSAASDQVEKQPGMRGKPDFRGTPSLAGMEEWLQLLGHSRADIDRLNIIHVAGTKGKGSTCAFTEALLRTHGRRTGFPTKTGLYTSPHLKFPEERIRINFQPLSRDAFAKYFFEVYDRLEEACPPEGPRAMPRYLQMYALMAFHAFIREGVEAAIFETHHGGEFDATNVIQKPAVAAVTSLGMDHVEELGPSIENIAWHKGGIFKSGAVALSSPQDPAPAEMLRIRAKEKGAELEFVHIHPELRAGALHLQPPVQQVNCSVAIAASNAFLARKSPVEGDLLSMQDIKQGIGQFHWPGRFQLVEDGRFKWFADGAHNDLSMGEAARWYADTGFHLRRNGVTPTRILLFSHDSDQRDGAEVLRSLVTSLPKYGIQFEHVIFTTYVQTPQSTKASQVLKYVSDTTKAPEPPEHFTRVWRSIEPAAQLHMALYIDEAVRLARSLCPPEGELHALVTGSQHLVGGVLLMVEGRA